MNIIKRDIIPLYLLRFVCAIMILLHHTTVFFFGININTQYNYNLDCAVDFFFVLSGAMMYYIYPRIKDNSTFLLQRFGKLYPVHILTALIALIFLTHPGLPIIIANLLGIQTFIPYPDYYFSLNSVSWCVSAELFFYICYVFGHRNIKKSLLLCMLINAFLCLFAYKYNTLLESYQITTHSVIKFLPPARVFQFFAGCYVVHFINKQKEIKSVLKSNLLVLLGIFLILFQGIHLSLNLGEVGNYFVTQYFRTILIAIGIYLCWYPCTIIPKKPAIYLGKLSFAIFMTHQIISNMFRKYEILQSLPSGLRFTIYCIIVFLASWACFTYIEEPVYKIIKNNLSWIKQQINKVKSVINRHMIYKCLLLSAMITLIAYPTKNMQCITLTFNADYTKTEKAPYIKAYYAPDAKTLFSEKHFADNRNISEGNIQINIKSPTVYNLRLDVLNFQEITLTNISLIGNTKVMLSTEKIKAIRADVDIKNNAIHIIPKTNHAYIEFQSPGMIYGKPKITSGIIYTALIVAMFILAIWSAVKILYKKKNTKF